MVENERRDVSLQTDFDSSDDEDDEELLAKKKNPWAGSSDAEEPLAKLMIAEKMASGTRPLRNMLRRPSSR